MESSKRFFAAVLAGALIGSAPGFAADFDQGIDVHKVVEDLGLRRPLPLSGDLLEAASVPKWASPVPALKAQGFLAGSYIQYLHQADPQLNQVEGLMKDLQYSEFPAETAKPLDNQWEEIQTGHDNLLAQAYDLDDRDSSLTEWAKTLDATRKSIEQRRDTLGSEIADYNADCGGKKLSPGEFSACQSRRSALSARKSKLEGEISQYNSRLAQLQDDVSSLKSDAQDWGEKLSSWFGSLTKLIDSIKAAFASTGTCNEEQKKELQDDVDTKCKVEKRACTGGQDCQVLRQNLAKNQSCLDARATMVNMCYSGQPDSGHQQEMEEAQNAIDKCLDWIGKKCGAG